MSPTIVTPRLLLRPWRPADREAWVAMSADPRVMEFLRGTQVRADALAVADRLAAQLERDGYGWWVAECAERGSFAGVIALQEVPFEAAFTPALEVGWRLAAEYWGRGYATEGARAALAFAFNELDRTDVVAITARINLRSQRVMQRLGMTYDATADFEHPRVARGDPLRPHVLYRIRRAQ
jgi:RimJ/RimL family protein N-acetyltransferase